VLLHLTPVSYALNPKCSKDAKSQDASGNQSQGLRHRFLARIEPTSNATNVHHHPPTQGCNLSREP